ncbi:MobQ family relaxase [Rosenbergiella nectarea]|uniref:MobQ family relaxase n=1 Tax=Rosenbergiella nectarea TaxID=988801 RepID=UPI001BDAEA77|nr:MobQ family relaxase [Rosenbergiella nectarea]MBT0729313.1 MobA/MobL family protein [Rosenbergiella nectarea subsp. apis]
MAIFHLSFNMLKRSEGKSSCYLSAYNARTRIEDHRTGDVYDYSHRADLFHHAILAPLNTPSNLIENSAVLWNEIEQIEKRKDAQLSRYFDIAIPAELDNDAKIVLVKNYCKRNFVSHGMIADVSFHDLNSHNPHAHVMLTLREITPDGFGKKNRSWNEHSLMEEWRASWAAMSNHMLMKIGSESRIDHRSLEAQKQEALVIAETAKTEGKEQEANIAMAKAIELNRPAMTRINRKSWHTERAKALRLAEQQEVTAAKQRANDFRQLFNSDVSHFITVNLTSFRIERVNPQTVSAAIQRPKKRSPELIIPEPKRRFNTIERKTGDMSLYYGIKAKSTPPPLLRRKRKLDLRKIYDFIKTFMSVLVKRPDPKADKPGGTTTPTPTEPMVTDPLDEVMIDPVTKLKITRRDWEAMGTASKPKQVSISPESNYKHEPEKKQDPDLTINFPPLPKESKAPAKSKGFTLPKLCFGSEKRKDV